MRLFSHAEPTKSRMEPTFRIAPKQPQAPTAPTAPPKVKAPQAPKALKAASTPKAPKAEKPTYAKFRVYNLGLYHEFKLAATARRMTLIRAFERAMTLFIAELTAEMDSTELGTATKSPRRSTNSPPS